jgi:hypothetical protein
MASRHLLVVAAVLAGACAWWQVGRSRPPANEIVATYGGRTVMTADVLRQLAELPPAARVYVSTPERKRAFVENMILADLLYEEGERLGYAADPEVTRLPEALRRPAVVRRALAQHRTTPAVTDAEVRRRYDALAARHPEEAKRPSCQESKEKIRAFMVTERQQETLRAHLESLRQDAGLVLVDAAVVRLDPGAGLASPPPPPAPLGH